MNRQWLRVLATGGALIVGIGSVAATLIVPTLALLRLDDRDLARWSDVGQALEPVGVFFSGVAFISIAVTLFLQSRELQKVAYEAGTIELDELRSALNYLMTSRDMHAFWTKARTARGTVTSGDAAEDFFTSEVDTAFAAADPSPPIGLGAGIASAIRDWREQRPRSR